MGEAHIKDVANIIGDYNDEPEIRYCEICLKHHGLHKILRERLYPPTLPNEPKKEQPRDHDDWLQCHNCGKVYAKYQTITEDKLGQFTETISNPHDIGHSLVGLNNKHRKSRHEQDRQRKLDEADLQPEEDARNSARHGLSVEIISDDTELMPDFKPDKNTRSLKLNPRLRD